MWNGERISDRSFDKLCGFSGLLVSSLLPAFFLFPESSASARGVTHAHVNCLVKLRLRRIHGGESRIPIALSGCLNRSWRTPILVGVTCLHALQLSSHSQIKAIIRFFQVPCKRTES